MKHTLGKRLLSLALVLVMVLSLLPAEPFHVHAAETESAKTTKKVTDEDTRLEIDYDKPFYKVDAEGNPVYDKNGQLIYLEPEQALAEEAESHRSSVSTYSSGQPMDHDYYWSYDNRDPWRQIYKGDKEELREWMESKDPDDGRIVLIEDIKITLDGNDNWEPIKITRDKVLDLNGKTLEFYDKRNGTKDQSNNDEHHQFYAFEIAEGAQLTIIDSKGAAIMTKDEKGEYVASNTFSGRIYANGYMINHQKWDLWYYTHRDIFRVTDGDLVIYGGEFQAGRQKDQVKTNFSWNKLKTVIGDAVTLGTSIYEYATGIAAAHAAKEDMGNKDPNANAKEEEKKNEDSETDNGKTNNGKTDKKDGTGGTEEKKTDTPASVGNKGDKSQQKDQTVAQKQTENNKKEDDKKKGDKGTDNKADDKKAAKKEPTESQLVEANKTIAQAYLNKDKITDMVDKAITFGENLYELFGSDESSRTTACIQGTVARIGNNSTLVIYDGDFVGHGSTPNVRNAVIEVSHSEILNGISSVNSPLNGKTNGGLVYVYGGTFSGYAGANVFNMYKTNNKLTTVMYEVVTEEVIDPNTGMLRYESKKTAIPKQLAKSETFGIEEVRYEKQDHWKNADLYEQLSKEEKENGPALVNTANIMVRGGNFRTYYEPSMMAVMKPETKGTNRNDGQYCPTHDADDGESESYGDECECDDQEHFKFSGTPGTVNLGVESYGEDMIKDGRIQIVDVYGQGNLVLLDGGDPIDHDPNGNKPNDDTYTGTTPENTYTTEGGFRHYRLFISDTELRGMNYLSVYPNTALTNSTFSFALETHWGTGTKTTEGWASDEENTRAPYSSNEKYFEFEYDDMDTSDGNSGGAPGVYIIPNLNMTDPFAAGEELAQSNVWYYNIPVNAKGESMSIPYADNYVYGTWNGQEYKVSYNRLRKEGDGWDNADFNNANAWNGRLQNRTYEKVTDESYLTNIKFFTYKVYRVDPLTRENINEGDEWSDNEPLIEVRYGASNQSLKCKITLKTLEKEIAEKLGDPNWSFHSGELYRVEFSVEEHMGYGYEGVQNDGEVIFLNTLTPAKAETSILFRCVEKTEDKLAEHYNPTTNTTTVGEVPDWTPLQFVKQVGEDTYVKDENLVAGSYATVQLINGQPSLVDWRGSRVFDVYYQWYVLDDPEDTTPTLIAGTDNVWVAQNSGGGKSNHKPDNWVLKNDGSGNGINDELYANTVDPDSPEATQYTYYPNGLPMNKQDLAKSTDLWDYKMLHMYTQETCPAHDGMKKYPDVAELDLGNNNPSWGNTDSVYIPEQYSGKYLQCKMVVVNTEYPHLYDNLQTITSHAVKIAGPSTEFTDMYPAVTEEERASGITKMGNISAIPTFSYNYKRVFNDPNGYAVAAKMIHKINGEEFKTIDCWTAFANKIVEYKPSGVGDHEIIYQLQLVRNGRVIQNYTHTYTFTTTLESTAATFTGFGPDVITDAEWDNRYVDLGHVESHEMYLTYEVPTWALRGNYTWEIAGEVYVDGKKLADSDGELFENEVQDNSTTQTRTGKLSFTPTSSGDHEINFVLNVKDENGDFVGSDRFTVVCYVVPDKVTGLVMTSDSNLVSMDIGTTLEVPVRVQPSTANQKMIYTSSNTDIVTVDKNGIIFANDYGSAFIVVEDENKQFHKIVYVTVKRGGSGVYVGGALITVNRYLPEGSASDTTRKPDDNYAYLTNENGKYILTLHNYHYSGLGYLVDMGDWVAGVGIYSPFNLTIKIEGEASFDMGTVLYDNPGPGVEYEEQIGIYLPAGGAIERGSLELKNVSTGIQTSGSIAFSVAKIDITASNGYGIYCTDTTDVNITNDSNIKISCRYNGVTLNGGNLNITYGKLWVDTSGENAIRVIGGNITTGSSGVLYARGYQNGVYVSGTGTVNMKSGNVLMISTNTTSDSSYCALKMSGTPTFSSAVLTATNNTGASYSRGYSASSLASYDFLCGGNRPDYFGVAIYKGNYSSNVYLFDGCMYKVGRTSNMAASESVAGTVVYQNGVLTLNDFDEGSGIYCYDYGYDNHQMVLIGDNAILEMDIQESCEFVGSGNLKAAGSSYWAVATYGSYTFSGTGDITLGDETTLYALFEIDSFTVNSGNVHVFATDTVLTGNPGNISINGGRLCLEAASGGYAADFYTLKDVEGVDIFAYNAGETPKAWNGSTDFYNYEIVIFEHDHSNMTYVEPVAANCHEPGREGYYSCDCGRFFKDAAATVEVYVLNEIDIPTTTHSWQDATCKAPKTCTICGDTVGTVADHVWEEANCTEPKTCSVCNAFEGFALGHALSEGVVTKEANCIEEGILSRTCSVCETIVEEKIAVEPSAHSITIAATCTSPAKCEYCGMFSGYALGHAWEAATCTAPKTCSVCNATEGSALGHNWLAATCQHPKVCKTCSITEGSALTHSWKAATCTEPKTCTICWQTEGSKLGHTMDGNECTACGYKAVDLKLTTATLRPGSVGLYFTADFTVASGETVVRSGVALSVYNHQPVADGSDPLSLYTKDNTSVIISNILSDKVTDAVNRSRAEMPIYARAYVELADGSYVYSDVVSMNLKQIVEMADTQWSLLSVAQKDAITDMYVKFKNVLDTWNVPNLKAY